jgi:hypothetical protein
MSTLGPDFVESEPAFAPLVSALSTWDPYPRYESRIRRGSRPWCPACVPANAPDEQSPEEVSTAPKQ